VKCKDCDHEYLLAFSWKCRCFQMVISIANTDYVTYR
jgi:hypothetical protein